jgi:hypothetical protein
MLPEPFRAMDPEDEIGWHAVADWLEEYDSPQKAVANTPVSGSRVPGRARCFRRVVRSRIVPPHGLAS